MERETRGDSEARSNRRSSRNGSRRLMLLGITCLVLFGAALLARSRFGPPAANSSAAAVQLQLASLAATQGEFGAATERSQRALQLDPNIPGAHRVLGYAQYRRKRFEEARASLEKAVAEKPDDAFAACFLGLCCAENPRGPDDATRARTLLEGAIGKYRGAEPWYGLGLLALKAGKTDEAIRYLEVATRQDPGWESGRYRLAEAYRLGGRLKDAEAQAAAFETLKRTRPEFEKLLRAVAENSEDSQRRLQLARLCLETRRYREALDQLNALANRAPSREVFEGLARAADAIGEAQIARRARRAAAEAEAP